MNYFATKLTEEALNNAIFGTKKGESNNGFIYIIDSILDNNCKIHVHFDGLHGDKESFRNNVSKFKELGYDKNIVESQCFESMKKYYKDYVFIENKIDKSFFENKFAFSGILIELQKQGNDFIIPDFLENDFHINFPEVNYITESSKLVFKEYTGEYPAMCAGDTIFEYGGTKITTKMLKFNTYKWELESPYAFRNIDTSFMNKFCVNDCCCGGCE